MKITHLLTALVLTGALIFSGCKGDQEKPTNREADSLKNLNGQLAGTLNEKEAAIQEFIESFNEIQENLNAIKEKEKIVTSSASKSDVKSRQGQIKEDMQAIADMMTKNRNRIGSLSQKLKDSNLKLAGLEKMIENLQNSLNLKDEEIADLQGKIQGLHIEISNLNSNLRSAEAENAAKKEALNTAYYAIGTAKELKEKKVISSEGGVLGLGKSTKLSEEMNKEYFTKINIEQTTSINVGAKKAKIVSNHPKNSYKVVGEKPVEKIEITNPQDFWSSSKYLVIVIE